MQFMDQEILQLCDEVSKEEDREKLLILVRRLNKMLQHRQALIDGIHKNMTGIADSSEPD